jgi:prophage tail gpP-like protein
LFEVIIDNRDGTMWNVSQLVSEASWKTSRIGKAGQLQLTVVRNPLHNQQQLIVNPGDVVRVRVNGEKLFYGYVFVIEETHERELRITAYDQLRYLMEADSYVNTNVTATQVIRDNVLAVGLILGDLAETVYAIPRFLQDGQKRLDIICKALDDTIMGAERLYVFYDDSGNLVLRDVEDMVVDLILGDGSLVYSYSSKREIDSDTYNRVKLVKDNKKTGKREAFVFQDSATIARWGRLQYFQKVDEKLNDAQIEAMAKRFIELKNREQRRFTLDALGYPGVRAGVKLQVTMNELGINQYYLVEECTHTFKGDEHTMRLELKVYG